MDRSVKTMAMSMLIFACVMAVGCFEAKAESGAETTAKAGTAVKIVSLGENGSTFESEPGTGANAAGSSLPMPNIAVDAANDNALGNEAVFTESTGLEVERVNVPQSASVLITLAGERYSDSSMLNLYLREHDEEGNVVSPWKLTLSSPAKNGRKGLYKEIMGDMKTPVGIFLMNTPFGIGDTMEDFPADYIKVDSSLYWNGDPESPSYNKLVDTDEFNTFDKGLSEHLINYGGYYDYCIDTGYNYDGTPYKGSAIFLHCMVNNGNTSGCIAVPEDVMIEIMKLYRGGSTYIAIYDTADLGAMYKDPL